MKKMIRRMLVPFATRKCRDRACRAGGYHTDHLTWIGKRLYT